MAHSAALRPFGFSQPTRITTKTEKRVATPIPPEDSEPLVRPAIPHRKARSHRATLSIDTLGSCRPALLPCQRRSTPQRSFPDEEDEDVLQSPRCRHEKRRPTRTQPPRHAHAPSVVSPMSPAARKKLSGIQLCTSPSEMPIIHEGLPEKQLQEQIKEVYRALRRVEDEREKILSHMMAGRVDQCRVERELEETRRENQRLTARLEDMLRSSMMKSPLSARSEDGWGSSMYIMDA
ncbi:hypothetical protein JB92DRAFT_3001665 [Gautieria morchelliformis]|nr:hypothetical protein JB92DRAFT_3001665 [Gautieria morchelliformis]